MGGGCYRSTDRDMIEVGSWCDNECFGRFGGCEGSITGKTKITKPTTNCEYRPSEPERKPVNMEWVLASIADAARSGRELFLYTPDMFQPFYLDGCLRKLPERNDGVYLAINACVRSFVDSSITFEWLRARGIREVWVGVESADPALRDEYDKPAFSNAEVIGMTVAGREAGVNVCWFLVDGERDNDQTRLATYALIREAEPYRVQVGTLQRHERVAA